MVAAVAEISHLRTACSYHAEPFVTMVALRPIFRPIGAAAPAFGPAPIDLQTDDNHRPNGSA